MTAKWTPSTWRGLPVTQVPDYPDQNELKDVKIAFAAFLLWCSRARRVR